MKFIQLKCITITLIILSATAYAQQPGNQPQPFIIPSGPTGNPNQQQQPTNPQLTALQQQIQDTVALINAIQQLFSSSQQPSAALQQQLASVQQQFSSIQLPSNPSAQQLSAISGQLTSMQGQLAGIQQQAGQVSRPSSFTNPPCPNSTCITQQTIQNTSNMYVNYSPIRTYLNLTEPVGSALAPNCGNPVGTGVTVHRQVQRGVWQYNDRFCLNQGCVYFGGTGNQQCQ